jgi:hypothetical protein
VEISYLSWNRKVQHILASTQVDGATVIWDLKKQRPVITLKDPNSQRRCSALQWNPEVATQLVVASDDDRSPTLQLWDLRNSMGPVKEFVGHTKGVLGMAWCAQDPGLLLSCSKDNRTICWEVATTDIMCELPASGNWDFDVQVRRGGAGGAVALMCGAAWQQLVPGRAALRRQQPALRAARPADPSSALTIPPLRPSTPPPSPPPQSGAPPCRACSAPARLTASSRSTTCSRARAAAWWRRSTPTSAPPWCRPVSGAPGAPAGPRHPAPLIEARQVVPL